MFESIIGSLTSTLVSCIIDVNKLYDKIYYQFFDNTIISFSKITKKNEMSIPYTQNIYYLWYRILNPFSIGSVDCSQYLEIQDKDFVIYEIVHNYDKKQHTTIITPSDLKKYLSISEKTTYILNFQMLLKELVIQTEKKENLKVFKFVNKKIMYVGINNKYIVTDTFTRVKHSFILSPRLTAQMFIDYVFAKHKKIRNIIPYDKLFVTVMDDDFEEHIFKGNNRFL